MNQIRVGIIGCGYWGPNLVRNFVSLTDVDVVAVADLRQERLEHIKSNFPSIEVTTDYNDLFSMDLSAVVVATPPATHFQIGKEAMEHGLHALIEKPLTLDSRDAAALVDIARQSQLVFMVGHTFEYNPAVQKVKEIIDSDELGKIHYVDAVRVNLGLFQRDLNVLWDLAPHDVSILRYLLGMDPVSVSTQGEDCIFRGKHDIAYMHMEFPNKILAHVHVSWLDPRKVRRITIVGSRKMLVYDDLQNVEMIKIYDKGVDALPYTDSYGDFQCSYRYGNVVSPYVRFTEPLHIECEHFAECIRSGAEPRSSGLVGLRIVQVLEAAQRSLDNGGEREKVSYGEARLGNVATSHAAIRAHDDSEGVGINVPSSSV